MYGAHAWHMQAGPHCSRMRCVLLPLLEDVNGYVTLSAVTAVAV